MSDSKGRTAESRNEDLNASDYGVFSYNMQQTANTSKQTRIDQPNLAKACDHHGILNLQQLVQLCVMLV